MADLGLEALLSEGFQAEAGMLTSWQGMRRFLLKSKTVSDLRDSIARGAVTENAIQRFVDHLGDDFEKGKQFPHELALGALAVALEERSTPFVDHFLLDLARLNIIEMSLCPFVARESRKRWATLPRTKQNENRFEQTQRHPTYRNRLANVIGEPRMRVVKAENRMRFTRFGGV